MSATSLSPEQKLIELILATSYQESCLELLRRKLASIPNTAPFALYLRLTNGNRTVVTAQMLKDFLASKHIGENYPVELLQHIINRYANSSDATLDLREFVAMILPKSDSTLRAAAALQDVQTDLSEEAEAALAQLIDKYPSQFLKPKLLIGRSLL
jgi:hypothetical protein